MLSSLGPPTEPMNGRPGWVNVGVDFVQEFLDNFWVSKDPTSLGVITDPADELFGLSKEDIADAEERAANQDFPTRGKAYRSKRDPQEGLLLIYPISGNSVAGRNAKNRIPLFGESEERRTVIGYAVSFPFSESPATVTYVQGPESRRR